MHPTDISKKADMTGMVAVVAGGAGGIGSKSCMALAQAGTKIAKLDMNPTGRVLAELKSTGVDAASWKIDVCDQKAVNA